MLCASACRWALRAKRLSTMTVLVYGPVLIHKLLGAGLGKSRQQCLVRALVDRCFARSCLGYTAHGRKWQNCWQLTLNMLVAMGFFEAVSMCCVSDWEVPAMGETASTFSCSGDADWMNTCSVTLWYNCVEGQHDLDLMASSTSTCVFCSTSDSMPKTPTTHCSHLSTHQLSHISCFSGTVRSIRRTFRTRFDLMLSCSMRSNEMV